MALKSGSSHEATMDLGDFMCHICLSILIEPVTMPCKHTMCKVCFLRNMEVNSLLCPMCKKRIGTWARRKKSNELIDCDLWSRIQAAFPEKVSLKMKGVEEDQSELDELFPCLPIHQHVEKGQIKKEFEKEIARHEEEIKERKIMEDEASQVLIQSMTLEMKKEQDAKVRAIIPKRASSSLSKNTPPKGKQKTLDGFLKYLPKRDGQSHCESGENKYEIDGRVLSRDVMDEHFRALNSLNILRSDEEFAKSLQCKENGTVLNSTNTPKRKLPMSSSSPAPAPKKMRQLSLSETFKVNQK